MCVRVTSRHAVGAARLQRLHSLEARAELEQASVHSPRLHVRCTRCMCDVSHREGRIYTPPCQMHTLDARRISQWGRGAPRSRNQKQPDLPLVTLRTAPGALLPAGRRRLHARCCAYGGESLPPTHGRRTPCVSSYDTCERSQIGSPFRTVHLSRGGLTTAAHSSSCGGGGGGGAGGRGGQRSRTWPAVAL